MKSLTHGFWVGLITFVATYGLTLIAVIPQNFKDISVGSILTLIVAAAAHKATQPATPTV